MVKNIEKINYEYYDYKSSIEKIKLDHLKIQVVMKQYILKDTPLEMFPIFIGAVSLCKFIVTYVDLYSNNNNNNNSTMPNPLIQSGIIQHFITLCVGNKKKKMKKKQNQKAIMITITIVAQYMKHYFQNHHGSFHIILCYGMY